MWFTCWNDYPAVLMYQGNNYINCFLKTRLDGLWILEMDCDYYGMYFMFVTSGCHLTWYDARHLFSFWCIVTDYWDIVKCASDYNSSSTTMRQSFCKYLARRKNLIIRKYMAVRRSCLHAPGIVDLYSCSACNCLFQLPFIYIFS